jgi:hypothetical protein
VLFIVSAAKVRAQPCAHRCAFDFDILPQFSRISVKKKMTQPPSAIPATIKHNNVEKGQVISRAAVQSFNTSRIVQCWAMNGSHGHVILNLARSSSRVPSFAQNFVLTLDFLPDLHSYMLYPSIMWLKHRSPAQQSEDFRCLLCHLWLYRHPLLLKNKTPLLTRRSSLARTLDSLMAAESPLFRQYHDSVHFA